MKRQDIGIFQGDSIGFFLENLEDPSGTALVDGAGLTGRFAVAFPAPIDNALDLSTYTAADGIEIECIAKGDTVAVAEGSYAYQLKLFLADGSYTFRHGYVKVTDGPSAATS